MSVVAARSVTVEARRGTWRRVVDTIDLELEPGTVVGLVGESGAGKTLFTRALVGLLPGGTRASGTIVLGGREYDARKGARSALGRDAALVQQNPITALDPLARVRKQLVDGVLRLGLMKHEAADARARELLGRLGFNDVERVLRLYPHQLSGGMAQRVCVALALMPSPELLIVDEPTSALDANVRVRVLELIRELAIEQRAAVVFVSHDLSLVGRFCDRLVVLYAGRIVEQGDTTDVMGVPRHPYTQALLGCAVTTEAVPRQPLTSIAGAPPAPEEWPAGCVFAPRCPHAWERCVAERPQPTVLSSSHQPRDAACHLVEEAGAAAPRPQLVTKEVERRA
ncbi:MAG TPA: ABC transporter ATP-binding protein [Conexibacter sp.]|jgi:oligopeptide/dipeptide ABC transporter ATP-binding protein|nr:ABC transporter ATP-binding protein [Conexibacter sp.]